MVFVMAIACSRFADFLMRPALSGEQYYVFVFKGRFIFGDTRLDGDIPDSILGRVAVSVLGNE
jgi:hypothetical protein